MFSSLCVCVLMQEILEQDERPEVCSSADDNEDNCEPVWWRDEDF